jgi:dephospho-CoA kinase
VTALRVGLTGGLASGKSTVGRLLRDAGCTVVDADDLVADLYRPGQPGSEAVRQLFGDEILTAAGGVDHDALARRIFADPEARRRLEAAIHPLVGRRFEQLAAVRDGIVVFEATLLVESGGGDRFDVLVTVEADPEERLRRAVERGLEPAAARARLRAQATEEERRAAADLVVENDGSLAELEGEVAELVEELRRRERSMTR